MPDFDESFWHKPKRPRREIAEEAISRLTFGTGKPEPPRPQGPLDMTDEEREAFHARGMELFAHDFVQIDGARWPVTKTLARQLGYEVDRLPEAYAVTAGDDVEARDD